ncbi:MAG: hypothetical protein WB643_03400 [Candidatus Bathyarchaeia archaeon]
MAPALQLISSGLILAETCETYPNSWAFYATSGAGSAGLGPAHSGGHGFDLQEANSTAFGDYVHLTKSFNLGTGPNRIARAFAYSAIASYALLDEFTGSSIDTSTWTVGGSVTVSSGIATFHANANLALIWTGKCPPPNNYYTTVFQCELDTPSGQGQFITFLNGGLGVQYEIAIGFNWDTANHITIFVWNGGSNTTLVDCGPVPNGYHEYKVGWSAGVVVLYMDGSLIGTASSNVPPAGPDYPQIQIKTAAVAGLYLDFFGYDNRSLATWNVSFLLGSQTLIDQAIGGGAWVDSGWVGVSDTGVKLAEMKLRLASGGGPQFPTIKINGDFDDIVVMLDKNITIQGLLTGQKVELLDSGNNVKANPTATTGVNLTIDVSGLITSAYGFQGHFKVYDVDGVTPLSTSSTALVWGGDVYLWVMVQTYMATGTNVTQIYRSGSGLSPGTALVTLTLTDAILATPISGKTIALTAVLGTCVPTSAVTDGYGQVATTYTPGSSGGLGGIRGDFAGDASDIPAVGQQLIDIYYGQVVPDGTKDFQAFLEGQELVPSGGNYKLSADFLPQPFTLMSPQLNTPVGGWWYIAIYRRGTLEFSGRVLTRDRVGGASPQLTLTGVDEKVMLQRRVTNKAYNADPHDIILDLLSRYPCGITPGTISTYGSVIALDATYENLYDALTQIANQTNWVFRLNADRTLDYAPSFGSVKSVTIASGGGEATADHKEDWSKIDTTIYVIGSGLAASLVGQASDTGAELSYGLIEEVFLEKSLTTQGAVDLRAQTLISTRADVIETITLDWIDMLATGAYKPYDIVTATDSDLELSGSYMVNTIQRDLADANKASLALSNRPLTIADALQTVRAVVKDLAVS